MPRYTAHGVTITSPRDLSEAELAQIFAGSAKSAEPPPTAARRRVGEIPELGQVVRDVDARQSFGWATPLLTSIVPTTYPELAAMLGLTLLGGPLAGAVAKPALAAGGKVASALAGAGARIASAAVPATAAGLATGEGATPGVVAGAGQAAIEGALPAVRSAPFVSQWLSKRAANVDAGKLANELQDLVPAWAPIMRGKKGHQALFDALVGPNGERAMYAAYDKAKDAAFRGQGAVTSPALAAYFDLKALEPTASTRIKKAADVLRAAGRRGAPSPGIQRDVARELFDELEKDAIMAARRVATDPHAVDTLKLADRARTELAGSLNAPEMLTAYQQTRTGRALVDFFNDARAIVGGPRYDAPTAMGAAATKKGNEPLAEAGLDRVTALVNRGQPGAVESSKSIAVPIGKGLRIPTGISTAHAAYTPSTLGLALESFAQPSARALGEAVME